MQDFIRTHLTKLLAAALFAMLALNLSTLVPTTEIAWVSAILLLTIYLFAFEILSLDVAALSVLVLLGLSSLAAPLMGLSQGLVDNNHIFNGFASNAVISIIAVMIIGAGLDKTGLMNQVANFILRIGGSSEQRIIPIISATVGTISSFMQNVGAAALFLPVISRISARTGIAMSRLLMPMGFTAILGGTMTMVGSSPLILLNDLILASNTGLAPEQQMATWSLFSVTPIGLALVISGILYFVLAGRFLLPGNSTTESTTDPMAWFRELYGLDYSLKEVVMLKDSPLVGKTLEEIETPERIRVIGSKYLSEETRVGPGTIARDLELRPGTTIAIIGTLADLDAFIGKYQLKERGALRSFADSLSAAKAGIAEIVIPPGSKLLGKSARDLWMRKTYGLSLIGLHRQGKTLGEADDVRNQPLQAGDTLVVHTSWEALARLEQDRNFVVVTSEYPHESLRPNKLPQAGFFFALALVLILFTDTKLSVALLTGALGMVISGVLKIEEAYQAVSWKTVFLLASLIPLGLAVETSGTAQWIASEVVALVGGAAPWLIQAAIALLATAFTLVMSNVGATVLLVPLAVNIAIEVGGNPAVYALIVALATSNSFIIPTHQVNALIMGPAGYRVADFMRVGGIMSVIFLVVLIFMVNLVF